jgi:hypothetical protein
MIMAKKRWKIQNRWLAVILGLTIVISLAAAPAMGGQGIDPDADKILKSMSSYLGNTKMFTMNADIDLEIVTQDGQKLQLSSLSTIVVERPAKFNITRKGVISDAQFIYDGKTLTLYGKNLKVYTQIPVSGTIDEAILAYEFETGLPAPGADLLLADTYVALSSGVKKGIYIGVAYVNGVECHHLAFRENKFDWQLWVKKGDQPLPMKYVITSKWQTGAPQFEIRLRDWDIKPRIKADQFSFVAPDDVIKLDALLVNEMGEFIINEEDNK